MTNKANNKKVKPLIIHLNTAREQAEYFFNREFSQIEYSKLEKLNPDNPPEVKEPSIHIIVKEWLNNGYADRDELLKEYRAEGGLKKSSKIDEKHFFEWIGENNREFDNYRYGDFQQNHYPMWGYVWQCPDFYINSDYMDIDKLYEIGIGVIEDDDSDTYLFIAGAGYDFYTSHWIPLFSQLGWIEYEKTEISETAK